MNKLLIALSGLSLASCAALPIALQTANTVAGAVATNSDTVVIKGTQVLILAHNAYQGASAVATAAIKARVPLAINNLDEIEAARARCIWLLNKGDAGQSMASRSAEVINLSSRIRSLAGE